MSLLMAKKIFLSEVLRQERSKVLFPVKSGAFSSIPDYDDSQPVTFLLRYASARLPLLLEGLKTG
jgi:hypothetical protein